MPPQNANSPSSAPLPLFRPEPIAARLRMEGEVLLVRPFSLSLLTALALAITTAAIACLLLIRVPHVQRVPVQVFAAPASNHDVNLFLPTGITPGVSQGDRIPLSFGHRHSVVAVVESSTSGNNSLKIVASIPEIDIELPGSASAEIPAGSRSLLNWLLHREGE
ncbi:MAG TPA: hypothetical protein VE783_03720 [Candidatus Limnocylindrales bacterium]|nr:hypothetical protein [Candidatus Limnocylindrales bacterium]